MRRAEAHEGTGTHRQADRHSCTLAHPQQPHPHSKAPGPHSRWPGCCQRRAPHTQPRVSPPGTPHTQFSVDWLAACRDAGGPTGMCPPAKRVCPPAKRVFPQQSACAPQQSVCAPRQRARALQPSVFACLPLHVRRRKVSAWPGPRTSSSACGRHCWMLRLTCRCARAARASLTSGCGKAPKTCLRGDHGTGHTLHTASPLKAQA